MKKDLNKILLEAVNRGINLALDDVEDQLDIQQLSSGKIKDQYNTKNYIKLLSLAVDLGLPSGTWWFKYNLGVNPDDSNFLDFFNSSWYGNYYAWGETKEKPKGTAYLWKNYKFGKEHELIKYNNDERFAGYFDEDSEIIIIPDNLTLLLPEDDIVTQIYGKGYHIPTKEQFEELIANTKISSINNYNNHHDNKVFVLTSKINGNQIYIPATGYKNSGGWNGTQHSACLWTSTLNEKRPSTAWRQAFTGLNTPKNEQNLSCCDRSSGFAIRPVYN